MDSDSSAAMLADLGGAALGGLFGKKEGKKNRDFIRWQMYEGARVQTEALRKAGINPILAASKGLGGMGAVSAGIAPQPGFEGIGSRGVQAGSAAQLRREQKAIADKQRDILDIQEKQEDKKLEMLTRQLQWMHLDTPRRNNEFRYYMSKPGTYAQWGNMALGGRGLGSTAKDIWDALRSVWNKDKSDRIGNFNYDLSF